jgi:hypothetical protein
MKWYVADTIKIATLQACPDLFPQPGQGIGGLRTQEKMGGIGRQMVGQGGQGFIGWFHYRLFTRKYRVLSKAFSFRSNAGLVERIVRE